MATQIFVNLPVADLARALKTVLMKYDALWDKPFPYLMAWYQAPTDGQQHRGDALDLQLPGDGLVAVAGH